MKVFLRRITMKIIWEASRVIHEYVGVFPVNVEDYEFEIDCDKWTEQEYYDRYSNSTARSNVTKLGNLYEQY